MLIVNSKQLPVHADNKHEMYLFYKEYTDGLNELQARFPSGEIMLRRVGYPKVNVSPDGSSSLPEIPAPIMIKSVKTDKDGNIWGYCQGSPIIHPNGLCEIDQAKNTITIGDEILHLPLRSKPDYTFFIMYKSGILNTEYLVYDPEGDIIRELKEKQNRNQVTNAIWSNMSDEKVRMMAQAWGVRDAGKKDILILKEELESKVFFMEEEKQKDKTNLMLRGIAEFLADARNDEFTRPKSIIQFGVDEKRITYKSNHFYFDGEDLTHVPFGREDQISRQEYLAQFFRDPQNKEKWQTVLKGLITREYIETLDKYGLKWLTQQFGIAQNQSEEKLRNALLELFPTT